MNNNSLLNSFPLIITRDGMALFMHDYNNKIDFSKNDKLEMLGGFIEGILSMLDYSDLNILMDSVYFIKKINNTDFIINKFLDIAKFDNYLFLTFSEKNEFDIKKLNEFFENSKEALNKFSGRINDLFFLNDKKNKRIFRNNKIKKIKITDVIVSRDEHYSNVAHSLKGLIKEIFFIENPCLLIHDKNKDKYHIVSLTKEILNNSILSKESFNYVMQLIKENKLLFEDDFNEYLSRKTDKAPEIIINTINEIKK